MQFLGNLLPAVTFPRVFVDWLPMMMRCVRSLRRRAAPLMERRRGSLLLLRSVR